LGQLYLQIKDFPKALEYFKEALELNESSHELSKWYMRCLFESGKYQELRDFCKKTNRSEDLGVSVPQINSLWERL
jgi:tetratricopeptide (TPR) repeat protein